MKWRSVVQLVGLTTAACYFGGTVTAQVGWPGLALNYGTTGVGGVEQITYGNGMFLAVGGSNVYGGGAGGVTATSPDGVRWAGHTNQPILGRVSGVCAGNSNFVAVGYLGTRGFVQLSADGVAWSQPVTLPSVTLEGVAYGNGTYVAVGQSAGAATTVTSPDGTHWDTRTFAGYGPLHAVAFGAGTFVSVGASGAVFASPNGSEWLTQTLLPGTNMYAVGYGSGRFIANAPDPSYILASTNGTNWVVTPPSDWFSPSAPSWGAVAYGNGLFVGIGPNIQVSTNGVDWTRIWSYPGALTELDGVAYGAGTFNVLYNIGFLIQISPSAFLGWGVETNGLVDLTLTGGWLGQGCRLQAATNLPATNWVDLLTFTNQGSVTPLRDAGATNYPRRFYRVAMP